MTRIEDVAAELSASCLLNAYLREERNWLLKREAGETRIHCCLRENGIGRLVLRVKHASRVERHRFTFPALASDERGALHPISFAEMVGLILDDEAQTKAISPVRRKLFETRILQSQEAMRDMLVSRYDDLTHIYREGLSFLEAEQGLLVGHSVHPTPKVREGFEAEDLYRYSPEFGQSFGLVWFAIKSSILHDGWVDSRKSCEMMRALYVEQGGGLGHVPDGFDPVPMHPWQWSRLLEQPRVMKYLDEKLIHPLKMLDNPWHATSSLRSIYSENAPYMLKFSMSVRVTNSVRHLMPWEAERGKQVCMALDTRVGQELSHRYPKFHFLKEPGYLSLLNADGSVMHESIVVLRENHPSLTEKGATVLATLTQDHPHGRRSRLGHMIAEQTAYERAHLMMVGKRWFECFLAVVVEPLLVAQAEYGLLFGAHQQNLLVTFKNGYPDQAFFRDCQGTGYTELAEGIFEGFDALGEGSKNILDGEVGIKLFVYYLIVNTTFGVIAALGADGVADEDALLFSLRSFLKRLRDQTYGDTRVYDYLLDSDVLWHKGNFYCNLIDMNENETEDPFAIYRTMPNPIKERISVREEQESFYCVGVS